MPALPFALKAVFATLLVVSIWRAFYGPPPEQRDPTLARLWGVTSALLYVGAIYALANAQSIAPLLFGAGVVALCTAVWHTRGDDGGGGGGDTGDDTGPIDWDRFDRARGEWERPRAPA